MSEQRLRGDQGPADPPSRRVHRASGRVRAGLVPVLSLLALALSLGWWQAATVLAADPIVVDSRDDVVAPEDGRTTLREAILQANLAVGSDTIRFALGGTYEITSSELPAIGPPALPVIVDPVAIDHIGSGVGPVTIDGLGVDGAMAFVFSGPASANSAVKGLTIQGFDTGITVESTSDIQIRGNVLGGNGVGIEIRGDAENVSIQDNAIGTDAAGTADVGNTIGIHITSEGSEVLGIGDVLIADGGEVAGNVIAHNGTGVVVSGETVGVQIAGNVIRDNDGLGIDLAGDGVTPNDPGDPDTGPNGLQNFPTVQVAGVSDIGGTLDAVADGSYRIDVYASPECDAAEPGDDTGNGEGWQHLGSDTPDSGGLWGIDAAAINGTYITATATRLQDGYGSTSEFSDCLLVTDGLPSPGTWVGERIDDGAELIPGARDVLAAGSDAAGPAQLTYGAFDPEPDGGAHSPSGEWFFYTTAAADGTIQVPWRYTGFHGFASVTVGLRAVVIHASDLVTQDTVLVDEGPISCCTEPSAGFDYTGEGPATFEVQAGDVYGFRLTGSNGDTNASLRGELVLGTALPTDCADAQGLYGATADGRYLILPEGGERYSVHCADMDATGKDYLELHPERLAAGSNSSSYAAGGAAPGETVTTSFTKLRFDPATLRVDIGDLVFAASTGSLQHPDAEIGAQTVVSMPYATAMACGAELPGAADIDLRGTPFAVDDAWSAGSESTIGQATLSGADQVVDITGNGNCGWMTPYPEGPFYVFNPGTESLGNAGPQFGLQLRYLSEPAVTLETPTLFAAVTRPGGVADLYVRIDGAENAPITAEVHTGTSCTGGTLGEGSPIGTATATTDAEGYVLLEGVAGISSGDFVALRVTSPGTTELSTCVRATAANFTWPHAFVVTGSSASTQDALDVAGQARWYRFPVVPDQRITVTLSSLPADYDLAVFKDIAREFESQLVPQDAGDLHQLSAEFAPSVFSPSVFSPSVFSPSVFSPDAYAPSVFSPSVFSPSVFSPSVFSPSVFSPSVFSPSVFSPSVFSPSVFSPSVFSPSVFSPSVFSEDDIARAFSSAQTRSLIGVSATPGTGDEQVVVNSWNNRGYFYVRVSGRSGAFDPDDLFSVAIAKSASSCENVTDTDIPDRAPAAGAGTYGTVILTDSSKLELGDADDPTSLRSRLTAFAARGEVDGTLVDVAADPRVIELKQQIQENLACPFAVNLLAEEIKSIVDSYRSPSGPEALRYVTIVGDDTVIPFFRYPDQSLLGQESGYIPPVKSDSISEASLRRDYVLSQDAYGSGVSIDIRTSVFPVPGLAVGRLVETPAEIIGMLDAYVAVDGVVRPGSSLATGYDFLEDAASEVSDELSAGTGAPVDELIAPSGISPDDPASWTAADLRDRFLGSRHDISFLAGHFSANSALAADFATSFITTELEASSVDLQNAIVFSAGCHSGYNLVDGEALQGVSLPLDWAQAFARKQAVLIAGTGYQYGDTDFLEYSERLYRDFAFELRAGQLGTAISVGEALARAKRTYLSTTPDIRGIHEKALLEATLFGLPMFGVDMPSGRGATPGGTGAITPTAVPGPAGAPALAAADIVRTYGHSPSTEQLKAPPFDVADDDPLATFVTAEWLTGPDGVVTNPAEPALPKDVFDVSSTVPGQVLRGVGFRGGSYTDVGNVTPLTGAPTTELRGVHAPFLSPVFYPMKLATPNYFGFLGGDGGTNLIVTPAQHKSDDANPGKSVRRAFDDLDLRLFYSSTFGEVALSDAPTIVSIESAKIGADLVFTAQVVGDPKAVVQEVWIVWTDGAGEWRPLDLVQCVGDTSGDPPLACGDTLDSRIWKGVLQGATGDIRYVVQAVNRLGLVSLDDALGRYHSAAGSTPAAPTSIVLGPVPSSAAAGGDPLPVTATLKAGDTPLEGKLVVFSVGGSSTTDLTDAAGVATAHVPLSSSVGDTKVVAAFGGDPTHLPSSASADFEITQAPSDLQVTITPSSPITIGTSASASVLVTIAGDPVPFRSIAVLHTPPGATAPTLSTLTTGLTGTASLPLPTGTVGLGRIEVRIGSLVTHGALSIDLRDPQILPDSTIAPYQVVWPFTGFFSPVDNLPALNAAKAGSSIPIKFALGGDRGLAIFASGHPKATAISCPGSSPVAPIEEVANGSSGLTYDPVTRRYSYVWNTAKTLKGCYRLDVKFIDGSTWSANFQFK